MSGAEMSGASASQDGNAAANDSESSVVVERLDAPEVTEEVVVNTAPEPDAVHADGRSVLFGASQVKTRIFHAVAFIVSLFVWMASSTAQTATDALTGFAVNPKLGVYRSMRSAGGAAGLEVNFFTHRQVFSVDYYRFHELVLFGPVNAERFNQIGLMYGVHKRNGLLRIELQGGLAPLWGTRRTDEVIGYTFFGEYYRTEYFFSVGVVGKAGFKFVPTDHFAIGVDLQANLNISSTTFSPMLSIAFGRFGG
ncbi:MAG: hypothetical protein ACFCUH_01105 [Flavobacteriales bacterium]